MKSKIWSVILSLFLSLLVSSCTINTNINPDTTTTIHSTTTTATVEPTTTIASTTTVASTTTASIPGTTTTVTLEPSTTSLSTTSTTSPTTTYSPTTTMTIESTTTSTGPLLSTTSTSTTTTTITGSYSVSGTIGDLEFGTLAVIISTNEIFTDLGERPGSQSFIGTGETSGTYSVGGLPNGTYYAVGLLFLGVWNEEADLQTGDLGGAYGSGRMPASWSGLFNFTGGTPEPIVINGANQTGKNIDSLISEYK